MLEFPANFKASVIADWIELELSLSGEFLSTSKLSSLINDSTGDEVSEVLLGDVWNTLQIRSSRLTQCNFELDGDLIISKEIEYKNNQVNQACLFLSLFGASTASQPGPKLFERISGKAIQRYIDGQLFIFGWPPLENTEKGIEERVRQVAKLTGEQFIQSPSPRYKDRGLDIVAWKPFNDSICNQPRTGKLVVLSQCAAGHDWRKKTRELPLESWKEYIHWSSDPVPAFSVPCVIDDNLWHDICKEVGGLVFDRIRIVNCLSNGLQDAMLEEEIDLWLKTLLEECTI
jgi:hypothetical protein